MRPEPRRWIPALALLAAAAAPASAADVVCKRIVVQDGAPTDAVTVKGTVAPAADLVVPSALVFRLGAFSQTVDAADVKVSRSAISFRAKKRAPGIQSFSLDRRNGTFSLTAKGVDLGDLASPVPFVLEAGRQRASFLYPLSGSGRKRSWKRGQPFQVEIAIRVLEVTHTGGNAVLAPATGRTFDPASARLPVGFRVESAEATVGADGVLRATIEATDPAVLQRVDLGSVIGPGSGVTDPPASRVTAGDDGEGSAVTFLEARRGDPRTLLPGAAETIVVEGTEGEPSGAMHVPAGAVASPLPGLRFTPLSFAVQLPAPVPDGSTPIAGAEISASSSAEFVAANAPTVELARPRWIDREALAESDIRLLAFRDGAWVEQAGRGGYDPATDRVVPDAETPARVPGTGFVVWVAGSGTVAGKAAPPPSRRKVVRGRVVGPTGTPLRGQAVLTRAGAMVTGADGAFSVDRSALAADSLEVIQAVGESSSTSRVVTAGEAAGTVEIRAPGTGPVEIRFGTVSGTVFEGGGVDPAPGAEVTIELASAVRGLVLDDGGTPESYLDDRLVVPDLSDLGVRTFSWHLRIPDDDAEFTSAVTGPSVSPTDLILEAQSAGRSPGEGAYTIRVSYSVPVVGELSLYAGFRVTVDGISPGVSDVQLPAAVDVTARKTVVADANGRFAALLRAPVGIPLTARAVRADRTKTDDRSFQFATSVGQDFVFPVDANPPVPAGLVQNAWAAREPMLTARAGAGSVVLGGKIWVAGGRGTDGDPLASLEVYDPLADTWTSRAPMATARDRCALAVARGRIWAIGGWDGAQTLRSVEVYDPVADAWTPAPPLPGPREDAKAAALGSRIYVCSGTTSRGSPGGDPSPGVEVFDLDAGEWSVGPEMPTALVGGDAVAFRGRLWVRGDGGLNPSLVSLEPETGLWTASLRPDGGASAGAGFCEAAGELWIVDGNASAGGLLSYDPESDTYGAHPASPRGRTGGCAESVHGIVYSIGGIVGGVPSASVDAFRPAWVRRTDMPTARSGLAAAAVGGRVLVAGGNDGTGSVATLESYDPVRNVWAVRAPMPTAREEFGLVALDGLLYAVGGVSQPAGTALASVEAWDPVTDQWSARAPMSAPRAGAAVVAVGGRIYAAGGGDATVEIYNPATNAWTPRAAMSVPRSRTAGATNGTFLFVAGGSDGSNPVASVEAFNPGTNAWSGRNPLPLGGGRERHAMTAVGGRLFAVGGSDTTTEGTYGTALRWVHVFEVTANRWTEGPFLPRGLRNPATATLDGVVYVFGGRAGRGGADHPDGNDHVHRTVHAMRPE